MVGVWWLVVGGWWWLVGGGLKSILKSENLESFSISPSRSVGYDRGTDV